MKFKEEFEKKAEEAFYVSFELEKDAFWGAAARAASSFFTRGVAKKGATSAVKRKSPGMISNFLWGKNVAPAVHAGARMGWRATKTLGKPALTQTARLGKGIIKAPFSSNKRTQKAFWIGGVGAGGGALASKSWKQARQN